MEEPGVVAKEPVIVAEEPGVVAEEPGLLMGRRLLQRILLTNQKGLFLNLMNIWNIFFGPHPNPLVAFSIFLRISYFFTQTPKLIK